MMAGIRGKDTQPELLVRRELFRRGLRYRLHARNLPGCPDLVFKKHRAVVFIHGCFWHGHACHLFKTPSTRREFWVTKIGGNRRRDSANVRLLVERGWRVAIVWECGLKGRKRRVIGDVASDIHAWLLSDAARCTIRG